MHRGSQTKVCATRSEVSFQQALPVRSSHLPKNQEIAMKRCKACREGFTDDFRFCPLDGTEIAIDAGAQQAPAEFHLTCIGDEGLAHRLANQLSFVTDQAKQAWPSFRNDPIGFAGRQVVGAKQVLKQALARPHVLSGAATALLVVAAVVLSVFVLE